MQISPQSDPASRGQDAPGYFKKPLPASRHLQFHCRKWLFHAISAVFRVSLPAPAGCGRFAGCAGLHGSLPDMHQAAQYISRTPHPRAHDPHRLAAARAVGRRTWSGRRNNHPFDQLHQLDQLAIGVQETEIARPPE